MTTLSMISPRRATWLLRALGVLCAVAFWLGGPIQAVFAQGRLDAQYEATLAGQIVMDGRSFLGNPLGFGIQGHNCGYRHRNFWTWAHAYFPRPDGPPSTLEALLYDMPFGLVFRKAMLWHDGTQHQFRSLREARKDPGRFAWNFRCATPDGFQLEAAIDGTGPSLHRLPYVKTDCTGSFEVLNNSLAKAWLRLQRPNAPTEKLETTTGAVLEMGGRRIHSEE